jgi:hypothetical protein
MTEAHLRLVDGGRPLVAALCTVPLVGEAVEAALDFADVRTFIGRRDTAGLLQWLKPDAVLVDNEDDARAASGWAGATGRALLHLSLRHGTLKIFRDGGWEPVESDGGPTPEAIRNVVAGSLFAREAH